MGTFGVSQHLCVFSAMQVSHGAIQFMVYEELKALTAGAGEYAKDTGRSSLSAGQISVIGAASKLAASVVTYPSQVRFPWSIFHVETDHVLFCCYGGVVAAA